MNPTDGAGVSSKMFIGKDRTLNQEPMSKKARRKMLKAKRQKFGDACKADFNGPWATYEGMEEFKQQKGGALTEQQKTLMEQYEEKRK